MLRFVDVDCYNLSISGERELLRAHQSKCLNDDEELGPRAILGHTTVSNVGSSATGRASRHNEVTSYV